MEPVKCSKQRSHVISFILTEIETTALIWTRGLENIEGQQHWSYSSQHKKQQCTLVTFVISFLNTSQIVNNYFALSAWEKSRLDKRPQATMHRTCFCSMLLGRTHHLINLLRCQSTEPVTGLFIKALPKRVRLHKFHSCPVAFILY